MGVQGLWKLLEPAGIDITLADLRGKTVAIDISIWLAAFFSRSVSGQFASGVVEVPLLQRLSRLMSAGIRPVLVFDGPTPNIKRRATRQRSDVRKKEQRQRHRAMLKAVIQRQVEPSFNRHRDDDNNNNNNDDDDDEFVLKQEQQIDEYNNEFQIKEEEKEGGGFDVKMSDVSNDNDNSSEDEHDNEFVDDDENEKEEPVKTSSSNHNNNNNNDNDDDDDLSSEIFYSENEGSNNDDDDDDDDNFLSLMEKPPCETNEGFHEELERIKNIESDDEKLKAIARFKIWYANRDRQELIATKSPAEFAETQMKSAVRWSDTLVELNKIVSDIKDTDSSVQHIASSSNKAFFYFEDADEERNPIVDDESDFEEEFDDDYDGIINDAETISNMNPTIPEKLLRGTMQQVEANQVISSTSALEDKQENRERRIVEKVGNDDNSSSSSEADIDWTDEEEDIDNNHNNHTNNIITNMNRQIPSKHEQSTLSNKPNDADKLINKQSPPTNSKMAQTKGGEIGWLDDNDDDEASTIEEIIPQDARNNENIGCLNGNNKEIVPKETNDPSIIINNEGVGWLDNDDDDNSQKEKSISLIKKTSPKESSDPSIIISNKDVGWLDDDDNNNEIGTIHNMNEDQELNEMGCLYSSDPKISMAVNNSNSNDEIISLDESTINPMGKANDDDEIGWLENDDDNNNSGVSGDIVNNFNTNALLDEGIESDEDYLNEPTRKTSNVDEDEVVGWLDNNTDNDGDNNRISGSVNISGTVINNFNTNENNALLVEGIESDEDDEYIDDINDGIDSGEDDDTSEENITEEPIDETETAIQDDWNALNVSQRAINVDVQPIERLPKVAEILTRASKEQLFHRLSVVMPQAGLKFSSGETLSIGQVIDNVMKMVALLGLPVVSSGGEAEAQCAWLQMSGQVDFIASKDSDCFLFGSTAVIKDILSQEPKLYRLQEVEQLGLTRQSMIGLALFLGSDYTLGIHGIGPELAVELLHSYNEFGGVPTFIEDVKNIQKTCLSRGGLVKRRSIPQYKLNELEQFLFFRKLPYMHIKEVLKSPKLLE
eukprot:TRINITY_DN380_c0_g1_i3.p1 TRINITY_DN380_c0_g1~~TRINITY_DN380_c0_g1_i3.p1  ORF type:complete len:1056 (-),score=396.08 TRINITY_DN380_c0_g1_i3:1054-4221(-)